jgi:hypothetical protein
MNALVNHAGFGTLPAAFAGVAQQPGMNDEFGGGIVVGFPVLSIKGKSWRVKSRGEEHLLTQPNGDPMFSLELVLIKATPGLTKVYYPNGYTEGANEKPTCWSSDGLKPDAAVPAEQKCNSVCATCPMNQFGSKVTDAGKQAKACSDSKRVAVVPANNMDELGGPALLRIPAATLAPFKDYADRMSRNGFPVPAIVTKVSFDANEAFPKLMFREVRPLTEDEAAKVVELRADPRVARILAEASEAVADAPTAAPAGVNFEQAPSTATQAMAGITVPAAAAQADTVSAQAIAEAQAIVKAQNEAREKAAAEATAAAAAAAEAERARVAAAAAAAASAAAAAQAKPAEDIEARIRAEVEAKIRAQAEAEVRAKMAAELAAATPAAATVAAAPVIEDAIIVSETPAATAEAAAPADFDNLLDGLLG